MNTKSILIRLIIIFWSCINLLKIPRLIKKIINSTTIHISIRIVLQSIILYKIIILRSTNIYLLSNWLLNYILLYFLPRLIKLLTNRKFLITSMQQKPIIFIPLFSYTLLRITSNFRTQFLLLFFLFLYRFLLFYKIRLILNLIIQPHFNINIRNLLIFI